MITLADSVVRSTARPLGLRARPDLIAHRQPGIDGQWYVVKDPLALRYYRFQEEEYAILELLDGRRSLEDVQDQFESRFRPQRVQLESLEQLIASLHGSGLLISDAPRQTERLLERRRHKARAALKQRAMSLLAIRLPGIDPERLLVRLYPATRWLFTRGALLACLLLGAAALLLIAAQLDTFLARLPAFHQFFSVQNLGWMMLALAVSKVLHEFGHALCCKHFGGECHEMGAMLLLFTPCLYVDVSDSWMLASRWKRAAIGAAGMYVELWLASLATFVWWFTWPGVLNNLALSIMFVCSVTTLLFNGNPLMRYDGYYILSDLLDVPNLRQKAAQVTRQTLSRWCLGLRAADDTLLPRRSRLPLLAAYSVAAAVYRWVVVLSILLFLQRIFAPYRLELIGHLLGLSAIGGLVLAPLHALARFFYVPGRFDQVSKPRLLITLALVGVVLAAVVWLPLPQRVYCPLQLMPRDAKSVYVQVPGQLTEVLVRPGQQVEAGQVLARLTNVDVQMQIVELASQRDVLLQRLDSLRQQRFSNADAALDVGSVQEALAAVERQLLEEQADLERLQLVAPCAGVVLPPPEQPQREQRDNLPERSGTPLDAENLNCTLQTSELFCQIGDPRRLEAILVVDQGQIDLLREGQDVEIQLDQLPGRTLQGRVREIARDRLDYTPVQLSKKAGGQLDTQTDEQGLERPSEASYQARVFPLDDAAGLMRLGVRGQAKIHAGSQTLAEWFLRQFHATVRFR